MNQTSRLILLAAGLLGFTGVALGRVRGPCPEGDTRRPGLGRDLADRSALHLVHAVALLAVAGWPAARSTPAGSALCWSLGRRVVLRFPLLAVARRAETPRTGHAARRPRLPRRLVPRRLERLSGAQGMKLPPPLLAALSALRSAGGRPRLVGGCVRDWLLGLEPKDFDIEVGGRRFRGAASRARAVRADRSRRPQLRRDQAAARPGRSTISACRGANRRPAPATAASRSRPTRR